MAKFDFNLSRGFMAFSSKQIASSIGPVTGEHFKPSNNTDDTRPPNINVSSQVTYQAQPTDTVATALTSFHSESNTAFNTSPKTNNNAQKIETAVTQRWSDTTNQKSEFVSTKSETYSSSMPIRRLTSDWQGLGINDHEGLRQSQPLHGEETIEFAFNLEQSCETKCQPLLEPLTSEVNYDFQQIQKLFHSKQYSTIEVQLSEIDTTTLNECALDHYDFIAGINSLELHSTADAQKHFEAIIKRERSDDDSSLITRNGSLMQAYYFLGIIHFSAGNISDAASCHQKGIDVYPLSKPLLCDTFKFIHISASVIYGKLGKCKATQNDITGAILSYKQGIEVATSLQDKINLQTSLGNILQKIGQFDKSIICYRICVNIAEDIDDKQQLEWANGNLGNGYLCIQQPQQALMCFTKSLKLVISYQKNNHTAICRSYTNLGTVHQSLKHYDKALAFYSDALAQATTANDKKWKAITLGNIGNLYTLEHKYELAIRYFYEVISTTSDKQTTFTAMYNMGSAQYYLAISKLKSVLDAEHNFTFSWFPPLATNLDSYFQCLKTYPKDAEIDNASKLLQTAVYNFREVLEFGFSHIPNTIARYKHELLKPALKQNIRALAGLQDCLLLLEDYAGALVVAEQTRETCVLTECHAVNDQHSTDFSEVTFPLNYKQIVGAITSSTRPTSYLSFTGQRLAIWFHSPMQNDHSIKTYVFPSDERYLTQNTFEFLKEILNLQNGINRLITQKFTALDKMIMRQQSITTEQLNDLVENLKPFISQIESLLPSEEEKQSILWIT